MTRAQTSTESSPVDADHRPIRDFIRLDMVSAAAAIVVIFLVNVPFVQVNGLYLIVAGLVALIGTLAVADRALAEGREVLSLALVAGGNWALTVLVLVLIPWLLPIMVLTVVMPLVLATPHLDARRLVPFLAIAAATLGVAGFISISNDDGGIINDIDDGWELVVIVGGMMGHAAPIGLIVWQANQRHRAATSEANRLNELLSDSRRRLVEAGDAERTRIERDLHDGAQQRLIAVGMQLRMLGDHDQLAPVIAEVEGAMADIRELSHGISPPLLELQGLPTALGAAARRHPGTVKIEVDDVDRWARSVETAMYFCATEALANAAKHAPAAVVTIGLQSSAAGLQLTVADDGPGFDPTTVTNSKGMVNMADRIGSIGGELIVDAAPGVGTTVTAVVPEVTP